MAVMGAALCAVPALARGEPVVGVDAAAALPLSRYQRSVDGGGAIGLWGGYGLGLTDWLWAGLILEPHFTMFSEDSQAGGGTSTVFSLTGGMRLTATAGNVELFFNSLGGLYTDVTGPFDDTGGGWNAGGGLNYYLVPRLTTLGVFARYDHTGLTAVAGSDADRQWVAAGLSVQHRFLEAPPAVSEAPPRPEPGLWHP
jgi:hypothetical protein